MKRNARRTIYAACTAAALTAATLVGIQAAHANIGASSFEGGDGNLVVDTPGNTDWTNAPNRVVGNDLPSGQTDNSFGNGTKEDNTNVTVGLGSVPNNKADLTRQYEASEVINGKLYLYLAWQRASLSGTTNFDFEINQATQPDLTTAGPKTLNRTVGDLLVSYDFQGGSQKPTLTLHTWTGSAWSAGTPLTSANSEGDVNRVPVQDLNNQTIPAFEFGEAAINLTDALNLPPNQCENFASFFTKSRASNSFTSEIKDFIAPSSVHINNCGTIKVTKVTENGTANDSFAYQASGLTPASFNLKNGETQTYNPVSPGSSSVTENLTAQQVSDGWTLKSLVCTDFGGASHSITNATANITMVGGGEVDCTYTNHINKSPTIATTLSGGPVNIGDTIHDSATLSGATADAGGTVTYSAYAGANTCSGTDLLHSVVTVNNGVVPNSADFTPTAAGTYSFQAVYSGDGNNNSATSPCTSEQLLVNKNVTTIATTLSAGTISLGGTVHDSSVISGATAHAGGTVTYHAYAGANTCTGTDLLNSTVTVTDGVAPNSGDFTPSAAGFYSFQAVYSGDDNNNGSTSDCSTEQLLVKTNPGILTTLSSSAISLGATIHDSSALQGVTLDAGGTVHYAAYAGANNCTGPDLLNSTVDVTNGSVPNSADFTPQAAGTYSFQAVYSGDTTNNGATSACSSEQLLVRATPGIDTTLSQTVIIVGNQANDSAALHNPTADAGGTVTYTVYTDSACSQKFADAGVKTVLNAVVPDSDAVTFNQSGTYYWQAVYSGDTNNDPATSACMSEILTVSKASPGASTAQDLIPNDSFTLSGGFNATGTITFNLYAPGDTTCTGPVAYTETVNVSGDGTYSTSNTTIHATTEGTWRWASHYSGDANNNPADSTCGTERFTIANS